MIGVLSKYGFLNIYIQWFENNVEISDSDINNIISMVVRNGNTEILEYYKNKNIQIPSHIFDYSCVKNIDIAKWLINNNYKFYKIMDDIILLKYLNNIGYIDNNIQFI